MEEASSSESESESLSTAVARGFISDGATTTRKWEEGTALKLESGGQYAYLIANVFVQDDSSDVADSIDVDLFGYLELPLAQLHPSSSQGSRGSVPMPGLRMWHPIESKIVSRGHTSRTIVGELQLEISCLPGRVDSAPSSAIPTSLSSRSGSIDDSGSLAAEAELPVVTAAKPTPLIIPKLSLHLLPKPDPPSFVVVGSSVASSEASPSHFGSRVLSPVSYSDPEDSHLSRPCSPSGLAGVEYSASPLAASSSPRFPRVMLGGTVAWYGGSSLASPTGSVGVDTKLVSSGQVSSVNPMALGRSTSSMQPGLPSLLGSKTAGPATRNGQTNFRRLVSMVIAKQRRRRVPRITGARPANNPLKSGLAVAHPCKPPSKEFLAFVTRSKLQQALRLLENLYETNICNCVVPVGTAFCISAVKPRREHASCRSMQFKSKAHADESWLHVALLLHCIEVECNIKGCRCPAQCVCLGEGGLAWLNWTQSSRKLLSDVEVSLETARLLGNKDEMGVISNVVPSLRYQTAQGALKPVSGKAAMFVVQPLGKKERAMNGVYNAYCRTRWREALRSCVFMSSTRALQLLIALAEEERGRKERELDERRNAQGKRAGKQFDEWYGLKQRSMVKVPAVADANGHFTAPEYVGVGFPVPPHGTKYHQAGARVSVPLASGIGSVLATNVSKGRNMQQAFMPRSQNPVDPWENVTAAENFVARVKSVQNELSGRGDSHATAARKRYSDWLVAKDMEARCSRLLLQLDSCRNMDPELRSFVGSAVHAVSPGLADNWLNWCKPATMFRRIAGTVTVTHDSPIVLTSCDMRGELSRGDAVMLRDVVCTVDREGKFDESIMTLSCRYQGKSGSSVAAYKCSDYTLESLRDEWLSFHCPIVPLPKEQRCYLQTARRFLCSERRQLMALRLRFDEESAKAARQTEQRMALAREEVAAASQVESITYVQEFNVPSSGGSVTHCRARLLGAGGRALSQAVDAVVSRGDAVNLDDTARWFHIHTIDLYRKAVLVSPSRVLVAAGDGAMRFAVRSIKKGEKRHDSGQAVAGSKMWVKLSSLEGRPVRQSGGEMFLVPRANSRSALAALRQLVLDDARQRDSVENHRLAEIEASEGDRIARLDRAQGLMKQLSVARASELPKWQKVGLILASIDEYQLKADFASWTKGSPKWLEYSALGFMDADLTILVDDSWRGMVRDSKADGKLSPRSALTVLAGWVREDVAAANSIARLASPLDHPSLASRQIDTGLLEAPIFRCSQASDLFLELQWHSRHEIPPAVLDREGRELSLQWELQLQSGSVFVTMYKGSSESVRVPSLAANTQYLFRVRSQWLSNTGDAPDGLVRELTLVERGEPGYVTATTLPSKPAPPKVVRQFTAGTRRLAEVRWAHPPSGCEKFHLEIADLTEPGHVRWSSVYTGSHTTFTITDLRPNAVIMIRVAGVNQDSGEGESSEVTRFVTPLPPAQPPLATLAGCDFVSLGWDIPTESIPLVRELEPHIVMELNSPKEVLSDEVKESQRRAMAAKRRAADIQATNHRVIAALKLQRWFLHRRQRRSVALWHRQHAAALRLQSWWRRIECSRVVRTMRLLEAAGEWIPHFTRIISKVDGGQPDQPHVYYVNSFSARRKWASHTVPNAQWQRKQTSVLLAWGEEQHWWDEDSNCCYRYSPATGESVWGCVEALDRPRYAVLERHERMLSQTVKPVNPVAISSLAGPSYPKRPMRALAAVTRLDLDTVSESTATKPESESDALGLATKSPSDSSLASPAAEPLVFSRLQISAAACGPWLECYAGWMPQFRCSGLEANSLHYFRVRHEDPLTASRSPWSSVVRAGTLPNAPLDACVRGITPRSVDLTWASGVGGAARFIVDICHVTDSSDVGAARRAYSGSRPRCRILNLQPGRSYKVVVIALSNDRQPSPDTASLSFTTPT